MVPNGGFSCLGHVSNFDQTAGTRMCSFGGSRGIAISGSSAASPSNYFAWGAVFLGATAGTPLAFALNITRNW